MFDMKGIYGGMIVGLFVQTLILVYVTFRTDWNREVVGICSNFSNLNLH